VESLRRVPNEGLPDLPARQTAPETDGNQP